MDAFISHASENSELAVKIEKFFEALYVNPNDLSAINGLGSILFYELELDAAEFFVRKAIELSKIHHMKYDAAEQDLALISHYKEKNRFI